MPNPIRQVDGKWYAYFDDEMMGPFHTEQQAWTELRRYINGKYD